MSELTIPQAVDLEEAVLGALMYDRETLAPVLDILRPDMMYRPAHATILKAIVELYNRNEPVDVLTVGRVLIRDKALTEIGGIDFLTGLSGKVTITLNTEHHAQIIAQKYIQRELATVAMKIQRMAYQEGTDVFELLDAAERMIFAVKNTIIRGNPVKHVGEITDQIKIEYEAREKARAEGKPAGITSGFRDVDRMTGGWQRGDLIILAARPAMGKTAFALDLERNAAKDGKPAALFSLEMKDTQLISREVVKEAQISGDRFKKGSLEYDERVRLWDAAHSIGQAKMFIDDTPSLSLSDFRAKARRLKSQHDIQLIVVDYLQLMTTTGESGFRGNREQEISTISRGLKAMAKELDIPIIALSQLSRATEQRGGDKRPQLSDLRESGAIEQDADMVLAIHRPEYYGFTQDAEGNSTAGVAEIIFLKHRNGPTGLVHLRFISKYTRFLDIVTDIIDQPTQNAPSAIQPQHNFTQTQIEEEPF